MEVARLIEAKETIHIDRSPEEVFDYFTDIANDPKWNSRAKRAEKTSDGPLGVGTTFLVVRRGSGPSNVEYVEYTRPSRWVIRGTGKAASFTYTADLAPSRGGTDLTSHMSLQPRGAFKLLTPMMKSFVPKQVREVHQALKTKLEGR
jgi:uncharacterized protein YndB with AHSA1/START domain